VNLHVQVRTSTGGTVQVPIWGKIGQIPQLAHLHSEKEEIKKTSRSFLCRPSKTCASVQVPDLACKRATARCQHNAKHIERPRSSVLWNRAARYSARRRPKTEPADVTETISVSGRLQCYIEFRDQDFKGEYK
jgi:hypothetical protein